MSRSSKINNTKFGRVKLGREMNAKHVKAQSSRGKYTTLKDGKGANVKVEMKLKRNAAAHKLAQLNHNLFIKDSVETNHAIYSGSTSISDLKNKYSKYKK